MVSKRWLWVLVPGYVVYPVRSVVVPSHHYVSNDLTCALVFERVSISSVQLTPVGKKGWKKKKNILNKVVADLNIYQLTNFHNYIKSNSDNFFLLHNFPQIKPMCHYVKFVRDKSALKTKSRWAIYHFWNQSMCAIGQKIITWTVCTQWVRPKITTHSVRRIQ